MAKAGYLTLAERGLLKARAEQATRLLAECRLCPRHCGANRLEESNGTCRTGANASVAGYHAHFGEEAQLVGRHGSGTIFFGSCNLRCVFCQNWTTSRLIDGKAVTAARLGAMMLELQAAGCHNINLVTPTHVMPQILAALAEAAPRGLAVPLVYNSGGYDSVETLRLLDGVVDIYMPDVKFLDPTAARRYLDAPDYPDIVRAAVREMHRQVGDLQIDERGIATRGLLVRHLVMPDGIAETREVCAFLARDVSPDTYVNVMAQYHPWGDARRFPEIDRRITGREHDEAVKAAREAGLRRLGDDGA
jgi:putative pyruvate formate lyase activating enzyme